MIIQMDVVFVIQMKRNNYIQYKQQYNSYTDFYIQELFPSAIMFGMSSDEFWEQDPKLYWAYRTFYLKQKEIEHTERQESDQEKGRRRRSARA